MFSLLFFIFFELIGDKYFCIDSESIFSLPLVSFIIILFFLFSNELILYKERKN